jgi:hypothetical protein
VVPDEVMLKMSIDFEYLTFLEKACWDSITIIDNKDNNFIELKKWR